MGPSSVSDEPWGPKLALGCILMSLLKLPAAWFQLFVIYLAPDINFRCDSNTTNSITTVMNISQDDQLWDNVCLKEVENKTGYMKCEHWQYDDSEFTHTITSEWDLVCDQSFGPVITQSSFFIGILFGNIVFAIVTDRTGRKGPLIIAILLQAFFSLLVGYSPTFTLFLIYRWLLGVALGGTIVISALLCGEMVSQKWRVPVSLMMQIPFGLGQGLLSLTAYFLRDWRDLNFAISIYSFIFLLYYCLIPESPRWLHNKQLHKNMKLVSTAKGKNFDKEKFDTKLLTPEHFVNTQNPESKITIKYVLQESVLRKHTICIFLTWFFAGVCFFSMNQYQSKLGGNLFFNVGIGGIIGGVPGNIASVYFVNKFGRKNTIIWSHIVAGLHVILVPAFSLGIYPEDWPRRLLGLITLMGMSVSYPALFLYSGELLAAKVRRKVMNLALLWHRLGSIVAPFVGTTVILSEWMPVAIIGGLPLITAMVMFILPETNDPSESTVKYGEKDISRNEEGCEDVTMKKYLSEPSAETKA